MRKHLVVAILAMTVALTGCGGSEKSMDRINKPAYEKESHETVTVGVGDLAPILELKVTQDGYRNIAYAAPMDGWYMEYCNVVIGQRVKKGDILASFRSYEEGDDVDSYKTRLEEDELLLAHYQNLQKVDKGTDYAYDIEVIKRDIIVCNLYISEIEARKNSDKIIAEEDGTITYVDQYIDWGGFGSGTKIIRQATGNGRYTVSTNDDFKFAVGDTYTAYYDIIPIELKLVEINSSDQYAQILIFEALSDVADLPDNTELMLSIDKPIIKDAIYVDARAVKTVREESFVFLSDEDGYLSAIKVELGDFVDDKVVIKSGLKGGEKVVIR